MQFHRGLSREQGCRLPWPAGERGVKWPVSLEDLVDKDEGGGMTVAQMGCGGPPKAAIGILGALERPREMQAANQWGGDEPDEGSKLAERVNVLFDSSFNRKNEANKFELLGYNEILAK